MSNKNEATYYGQSQLDHAWRTIPAECRGVWGPGSAPAVPRPVPAMGSLHHGRGIGTFVATAAFVGTAMLMFVLYFGLLG